MRKLLHLFEKAIFLDLRWPLDTLQTVAEWKPPPYIAFSSAMQELDFSIKISHLHSLTRTC
jgi:hypothetical protein